MGNLFHVPDATSPWLTCREGVLSCDNARCVRCAATICVIGTGRNQACSWILSHQKNEEDRLPAGAGTSPLGRTKSGTPNIWFQTLLGGESGLGGEGQS